MFCALPFNVRGEKHFFIFSASVFFCFVAFVMVFTSVLKPDILEHIHTHTYRDRQTNLRERGGRCPNKIGFSVWLEKVLFSFGNTEHQWRQHQGNHILFMSWAKNWNLNWFCYSTTATINCIKFVKTHVCNMNWEKLIFYLMSLNLKYKL